MAAYPVSAINREEDSMIVAAISLDWMASIMSNLAGRPGLSALLIDSAGTVMAAPPDQASTVGRPLDNVPLLSAIADKALARTRRTGCFLSPPSTAQCARSVLRAFPERNRVCSSVSTRPR